MKDVRPTPPIEILALQALAHQEAGETAKALAALAQALEVAEPEGFLRIFLDEGEPMHRLLRSAVPREVEILQLIAGGMRTSEIARQLFISPATVKRHAANIYGKLEVGHRTAAVARARELQLL